ncbi:hypothetical protein HJC23_012896 [Cyclotella cryptica]|uniref:Uncharacterized protein n=1 Tax=Cyclotella cryptica TaxID=29204 RepID=A0ABD3Q2Y4_9STRA|eukprot:CCRYP_009502-RB/>CCRYP_009502-RB protein AED:0.01 eAED:0.01 QI:81/1/1/1/1/1/3/4192/203
MYRLSTTQTLCLLLVATIHLSAPSATSSLSPLRQSPDDNVNNSTDAPNGTIPDGNSTDNGIIQPTAAPAAAPSRSPEVFPPPTPLVPTTHEPTRKYEPSSDDDETGEEGGQQNSSHRIRVVLWSLFVIVVVAIMLYFRDPIIFFLGTVCINTNRYGCKGCLQTCFPCIFGSQMGGYNAGGGESLDQIIFETEDDGLRRGLMNQ